MEPAKCTVGESCQLSTDGRREKKQLLARWFNVCLLNVNYVSLKHERELIKSPFGAITLTLGPKRSIGLKLPNLH